MKTRLSIFLVLLLLLTGCSGQQRPEVVPSLRDSNARNPVVLLPGLIASKIKSRDTGKVIWGRARTYVLPKDGGYRIARPIDPDLEWEDDQKLDEVTTELRVLGLFRYDVYQSLVDRLVDHGYQLGDIENPRPDDTLFLFPYDLRYDNVTAARDLAERLEAVQRARGGEPLEVDLICHSNAAHIARYFLKYGGELLERAEQGVAARPEGIEVGRLILVGGPNGGTIVALHDMSRGERYFPLVGRTLRPETLFTFRSVFDLLPVYRKNLFVDEQGESMEVDLFDAESWRKYGWSIYSSGPQERLRSGRRTDLFADEETRFAYLQQRLDRARRFNRLLTSDSESFGEPRYYMVQGVRQETPNGALLLREGDGWRTLFSFDRQVKENHVVYEAITVGGDGVAPPASVDWLSPQERAAIRGRLDTLEVDHRWMVQDAAAQRQILEWLTESGSQKD